MEKAPSSSELREALNVLNQIIEHTNEYNKAKIEQFGLTEDFAEYVGTMSEEDINQLTLPQINSYLEQYGIDSVNILQYFAKGDSAVSTLDKWKDFFLELRRAVRDMDESLTTRAELEQACREVFSAQIEYIRSDEYKTAYNKKLERIRQMAEEEPDEIKRKAYLRKLNAVQQSRDLSFLLSRIDDPKINKKNPNAEIERLVDIFFDKNRGSYLMDRYVTNIRKLKISADFHVNLYDIEEKFMPEFFYPLNNFFLFVVMSYISYINPDDDVEYLYATTALSMMGNLLLGALSEDEQKTITDMIRNIENRIVANDAMMERFRNENTTWKEHPVRKELDAKREEMKYRLDLISEIKTLMVGFGAKLSDGTELTAKNASSILKTMATEQIEGIRDDVKAEAERHAAEVLQNMPHADNTDAEDNENDKEEGESENDESTSSDDHNITDTESTSDDQPLCDTVATESSDDLSVSDCGTT